MQVKYGNNTAPEQPVGVNTTNTSANKAAQ